MTTQVTKTETNKALATPSMTMADFGIEDLVTSDIKIPRALLLQKMSKMVDEEKGKPGEIRGSLEYNLLGGVDKPWKFVPLYVFNTWIISEATGNKFVRTEPRNSTNSALPWDFTENGKAYKRTKVINSYVMGYEELTTGEALPYLLSFRSTSFNAGSAFVSILTKLSMFGKQMHNYIFQLQTLKQENEKGTFWVFDLSQVKGITLTQDQLMLAEKWRTQVTTGRVVVDDATDEETTSHKPGEIKENDRF